MPGMTTKIALRGRNQESYRRWIANRDDCTTAQGLDGLMANAMMPTLDTVKERYPDEPTLADVKARARKMHDALYEPGAPGYEAAKASFEALAL